MNITQRSVGKVSIVDIEGKLMHANCDKLREKVAELLEDNHTKMILNLDKVSYIDSSGLGELVACMKRAIVKEGDIKLLNPRANVLNLLILVKLSKIFKIYKDEKAAVSSF